MAAAPDLGTLPAAALSGTQRCSGGWWVPCGATSLPGTAKLGVLDGQRSSGGSRGQAHPRQATAVAGGVKAWSRKGQRQLRLASAAPPPAVACPRCSSSVSAAHVGAAVGRSNPGDRLPLDRARTHQSAAARGIATGLGGLEPLRGEGLVRWGQRQRQTAVPPHSCLLCRHSSFRLRSPSGGHSQCPARLCQSCHQRALRPPALSCFPCVFFAKRLALRPPLWPVLSCFGPGCPSHWRSVPLPAAAPSPRQHQAVSALGQRSERGQGVWCMVLQGSSPGPARPRQVPTAMAVPAACTELLASFACPHACGVPAYVLFACLHMTVPAYTPFPPCFPRLVGLRLLDPFPSCDCLYPFPPA